MIQLQRIKTEATIAKFCMILLYPTTTIDESCHVRLDWEFPFRLALAPHVVFLIVSDAGRNVLDCFNSSYGTSIAPFVPPSFISQR